MEIHTRTASIADTEAICTVLRRSITECCAADHRGEPRLIDAWLRNKTAPNVTAWIASPGQFCVVALVANEVVGFGMAEGDQVLLCYVLPEIRFKGAGRVLLQAMELHAVQQGITPLRLESTRTALAFYRRNGFSPSGPAISVFGLEGQPMLKQMVTTAMVQA